MTRRNFEQVSLGEPTKTGKIRTPKRPTPVTKPKPSADPEPAGSESQDVASDTREKKRK